MARISVKNNRYRTKKEIAKDVASILRKRRLAFGTKYAVLKEVTWVWSEFEGKYDGCRYWSLAAIKQRRRNKRAKLIHEHIVPKKIVLEMLMGLNNPTPESVRRRMARYLKGVVITPAEHTILNANYRHTMPSDFYRKKSRQYKNPWLRYRKCGIKVTPKC